MLDRSRGSPRGTARARAPPSPAAARHRAASAARRRGVGERAQHPGHVAQRAPLAPPLGQRPGRLALEVDDHPVAVGSTASARGGSRRGGGSRGPRRRGSSAGAGARAPPRRARGSARARARRRAGRGTPTRSPRRPSPSAARATRPRSPRARRPGRAGRSRGSSASGRSPRRAGASVAMKPSGRRSSCRARAPSRRCPSTNCWRMPSVASICRPVYEYQPTSRAMFANPCSVEEAQQLELRVDARLEPAEDLEDQLVVEHDRRVRLLGADGPRLAGARRRSRRRRRTRPTPSPAGSFTPWRIIETSSRTLPRVGERIERLAREQLVGLVRAGVEADLDEQQLEPRLVLAQDGPVDDLRVRRRPSSSTRTSAGP